ncbi:Extracellular superoxide dismutase [Cu-Zn] [Chlamydiales bacterium SCGC AG-110-M15]|nr:Extracellular superoxide dismutase [Cu-Zn] [Chlamydiales bacterium SCGC AG-110-M15]
MGSRYLLALFLCCSGFCVDLAAGPACGIYQNSPMQTGTAEGSLIGGEVILRETADGLHIQATLTGVPEGKHGFHIHEFGDVGNGGKNAGGHYNPEETQHGYVPREGIEFAHAGDLGNIEIGSDGRGGLTVLVPNLCLTGGKYNVAGRAIIVHEKEDDFGQPTGNAGSRIAAGSILLVNGEG